MSCDILYCVGIYGTNYTCQSGLGDIGEASNIKVGFLVGKVKWDNAVVVCTLPERARK